MEKTSFDPTRRRLCPDGACIGVIGSDGRCRECGRKDDGKPVQPVFALPADEQIEDEGEQKGEHEHEHVDADVGGKEVQAASGGFDPKRRLCEDGSCLGVVRADGLCSVCGRRMEG